MSGPADAATRWLDHINTQRMPAPTLRAFLDTHPIAAEEAHTIAVIHRLRLARSRGYLTQGEFLAACNWKSARARRHFASNSRAAIRAATAIALRSRSERARFDALTALSGVSAPMASAILTLTDPRRYGVIDIRFVREPCTGPMPRWCSPVTCRALLDYVGWTWSTFDRKIDGCRLWSKGAVERRTVTKDLRHEHAAP